MTSPAFDHVFKSLKIGPVMSRNRIEVSPSEPFLCTKDGLVTDAFVDFTAAMARGGAGVVTIGDSPVTQAYADANHYVVNLADPFVVHGLVQVTEAIHRYGALASIELNLRADFLPEDITVGEVRGIIDDFAAAAERCRKGGFDMVMLHGGHGHTVAQFFSPYFNKRIDRYGCGTFENRCRFACELIDAVREAIGPDMALEYRISGDEKLPPALNVGIDDMVEFARNVQTRIDLLNVSAGNLYQVKTIRYMIQDAYMPRPTNADLARRIRAQVEIPITSVGSYTMELAEQALADGTADMVAMIRPFIADPDQVVKARRLALGSEDPRDRIRPCLRCNICTGDDPHGCPKPLRCSVNPRNGLQPRYEELPAITRRKRVVVIGGGCAGLEAARWLAERGHEPIVLEREEKLGGSLIPASANELKSDVRAYVQWSVGTVVDDGRIQVKCGIDVTPDVLREMKPDALIIAVGSAPRIPDIPGLAEALRIPLDNENGHPFAILAKDADLHPERVGKRVIVAGGGLTGMETAAMLARAGHEVTLADSHERKEMLAKGRGIGIMLEMLEEANGNLLESRRLVQVGSGAVVLKDANTGEHESYECDTVVVALGVKPRDFDALMHACEETYVVGDCCTKSGNIMHAVRQAFDAAMRI